MPAILVFGVFLVAIAFAVPIGIAMVAGSLSPIVLTGTGGSIPQLINNAFSGANSTPILAVPLFIFGGIIMAEGGISKKLFNFFAFFVGRFHGGIPCAVILTCLFYGAISGSGPATAAAVGAMCVPFLVSLGYERQWSAAIIVVAGGLGVIIPPSIPFILYSLATGVSTGDLFIGGILPGILIGLCLMIYCIIHCRRKGENRERIQDAMSEFKNMGFGRLFIDSLPALLCPIIVLGGIYAGFVTPTEAACISVFYALIVALFIYRSIKFKDILEIMVTAVRTYAGLAFVLAFATAFGRVLSLTGASSAITTFITGTFDSVWVALTVCVVLFLILGMVMDTGPAIIILAPILLPAMEAMGMDPVHFGVVLVCCLAIGLATLPFGLNLFVVANISQEKPMAIARQAVPFILTFLIALILIVYIPWFSTWFLG
ncbi:MAG: TRAP transporter large permease [Eggerthellaceae bacterium]